ncbi:MAG TPA: TonB-dependent receptor [Terriglobia bacterium]|nr:TonB-dependent receptor [Terriglobia bacterium]
MRSLRNGFMATLVFVSLVTAQGVRATVVGRVTDDTGAVVPGAKITITNVGTNESRSVIVNDSGEYAIPQLAPGQYTVTAEYAGFNKVVRSGIVLETSQQARIDIALKVGTLSEEVEVNAAAPLVTTENAALGNVVDQKKIVELPLNGRDYLQLAFLQPNVFAPAANSTLGFRGGLNVAGNSEIANQYILDGVDNNDETTNQPLHRPILDAVREFKVLTGTYSAEYGRQAGGQVIVTTQAGTNAFHGSVWEFHRNSVLDARNFFATQKPSFRRNQFGGVLGGPIRKDRTFFFAGYEGQRRGQQEASLATVPASAFRNGDFSSISTPVRNPFNGNTPFPGNRIPQAMWSKQGSGILALYPLPNRGGSPNFDSAAAGHFSIDQWSARVDHRLGMNDNVYGAYEFADSSEFYALSNPLCSARDVPGWGCDELQRTQHAVVVWTHIFSQRLVNEARIGYTRFGFYRLQQDRDVNVIQPLGIGGLTDAGVTPFNNGAPQIQVTGYATIGGPTNLPQGRHDNTYNYIENMTFITGQHSMKFGFDIRRFLFNSFFTSFGRGAFQFDGTFTGNPVADLLLGMPRQADRNLGTPFHNSMTFSSGYYFQDDWKIAPKLTLNLGVRYDLDLPETERVNKIASFDPARNTIKAAGGVEYYIDNNSPTGLSSRPRPEIGRRLWSTDKNNFAPRIGLAWRPFGGTSTVVRAGFGTFYNHQIVGNGLTPLSRNSPFRLRQTSGPFQATDRPDLANAFSGIPSVVAPGIDPNFTTAYVNQWSFGIQRELASNLILDISYLGSQGHKLPIPWNINQALPGPGSVASRRPFPGYGNITGGYISSIGNSNFNSLSVRAERRMTKGLSFISSYAWSKSVDDNAGVSTGSDASGVFAQDARNLRVERSVSDYDIAHRFVFSTVYDLPFGNTQNRTLHAIAAGWQLSGILTLQTGPPFTVFSGRDESNTGGGATQDRPNLIGNPNIPNPGPDRWFNTCTLLANGTQRNCLPGDTPAWQINAISTFGNAGRNILRSDGLKNIDVGLSRSFRFTERVALQFRSEFFNVTNHPNFVQPNQSAASGSFATVSRAAFQSQTGAQRQIQFAAKVVF